MNVKIAQLYVQNVFFCAFSNMLRLPVLWCRNPRSYKQIIVAFGKAKGWYTGVSPSPCHNKEVWIISRHHHPSQTVAITVCLKLICVDCIHPFLSDHGNCTYNTTWQFEDLAQTTTVIPHYKDIGELKQSSFSPACWLWFSVTQSAKWPLHVLIVHLTEQQNTQLDLLRHGVHPWFLWLYSKQVNYYIRLPPK